MKTQFALLFCLFVTKITLSGQDNCFEHCWENLEIATREQRPDEFRFPYQKVMTFLEGCPMPSFEYRTLNGNYLVPESLKGRIVVMNFWFQSCTPCRNELPGLNKLAAHYSDQNVVFIAIGRDGANNIREFLKKNEFNFVHVPDSFDIGAMECFCVMSGFPLTLVFDQNGILIQSVRGGSVDPRKQFEIFDKLQPVIDRALLEK
jgi:peroxiredoxin